ncbi:drug/metabolite transporter (DMT)-like permease [Rhizobium sp. SG_E_25_P2]|uniref:DMT family transporter n=1 Tax=Rhizobium sp. SG_E_25_P2 TaxID=2879942 RepID=UPI002473F2C7|nr:DMT family transporter [Rhizobium sp. SG_E_25_P2]MDH6269218.1 drug/metabolite transporter (DMT)-like permease [Rhizobium sp. SG_E_25_P2]
MAKAADQPKSAISPLAWALLILLGLLWGGSFFFARVAVQHVPPLTLALSRFVIAAIALHIYLRGRNGFYQTLRSRAGSFLLLGLLNNAIPHSFIFIGQTHIGAGLASILNATTPVWTVLIAHALTRDEKLTGAKLVGVALGLSGAVLLFSPHLGAGADAPLWAIALPLLAAVSYGFAAIFSKRFRGVEPTAIAAGQLTASTLIMTPVALIVDQPWSLPLPPPGALAAMLALALVSTAFAYILFFRIIALAGATNASLVTLLVPPSAILLGMMFLDERLEMVEWAGMGVIALGLVVLDGRLASLVRRSAVRARTP